MSSNNCVKDLFIRTPLLESIHFDKLCPRRVYLKLENCQPSGSFKMRGISRLCQQASADGCEEVICSSGGNAGLAAANSARQLNMKCKIFVPKTTSQTMKEMIEKEGADIEVCGNIWDEANEKALEEVKRSSKSVLAHPFDNPVLWSGHSTIIDEISDELKSIPSMIISSCGGGGLICGLIQGMRRHNWTSVPILAMETIGADCFNAAVRAGKPIKPVMIPTITSVATTLGALAICQQLADEYNTGCPPIISKLVNDREAVNACLKFADQHRIIVEPACGTSLAALYTGLVLELFEQKNHKFSDGPVVVIVCGGASLTLNLIEEYKNKFSL